MLFLLKLFFLNAMVKRLCFLIAFFCVSMLLGSCKDDEEGTDPPAGNSLQLVAVRVGDFNLDLEMGAENIGAPTDRPVVIRFSSPLRTDNIEEAIRIDEEGEEIALEFSFLEEGRAVSIQPVEEFSGLTAYTIVIEESLEGAEGEQFPGIRVDFTTEAGAISVVAFEAAGTDFLDASAQRILDIPLTFEAGIRFSEAVDPATINTSTVRLVSASGRLVPLEISYDADNSLLNVVAEEELEDLSRHTFFLTDGIRGTEGEVFGSFNRVFYTQIDSVMKFEEMSDEDLLTLVQQQTFRYFWDFAHQPSGMARERNTSGNLVTVGGSGFGLMAVIVGIERGFISREQGVERLEQVLTFLEGADRFHGAWPHWLDGNTGATLPFSEYDDGADLVETSFMIQALLSWRQYLNSGSSSEALLVDRINTLWEEVEWDWFTRDGNVLYWHWSPEHEWRINLPIRGYNEALITYFLAAASPTHPIEAEVYHQGWAGNEAIRNGQDYYGINLPLGEAMGGPLFFSHYSFLGLDPRGLSDTYANYFEQGRAHTLINRAYAIDNPRQYVGYGPGVWGLTASDNPDGYSAHSPTNDVGTITPTAALSSMPYTPEESIEALRFFYYYLGDRLWGEYGFYDAFDLTRGWVASSYLAIDQGPIIIMIENYRTGLLWELFMANPEVDVAMEKLGFTQE